MFELFGRHVRSKTGLAVVVQVREKAALCLGNLCVGEPNFPHRMKIIQGLVDAAAVSIRFFRVVYL